MLTKFLPKILRRYSNRQCLIGSTSFLKTNLKTCLKIDKNGPPRFFATSAVDTAAAVDKQPVSSGSVEKSEKSRPALNQPYKTGGLSQPPTAEQQSQKRSAKRENVLDIYARQNYRQLCDELLLRENGGVVKLAQRKFSNGRVSYLLPNTAISLGNERNFVDRYLTAWWKDFVSPNYAGIDRASPRRRIFVLKCLYALDHVTGGDVVKKLTWKSIDDWLIRNHVTRMSSEHVRDIEYLLFTIAKFLNDPKYVQTVKPDFVKNYSQIFWREINAYMNNERFRLFLRHSLGPVLNDAAKCGFRFNAAKSTQSGEYLISPPKFAEFCMSACRPDAQLKHPSDFYRFFNCSLIGEALTKMNFDPEQHQVPNFWSSYFQYFMTLFEKVPQNSQQPTAATTSADTERAEPRNLALLARQLDTCLHIALWFGKFAEFEKTIKPRFIEKFRSLINELEEPARLATLEILKANQQNESFCAEFLKLYEK